jgi:hypothetical protein
MIITIKDSQGTLPGASIYASDATGNYIPGGYGIVSDVNGQASVPDNLEYITVSFIGYEKQTFAGDNIPEFVTMQQAENMLEGVTITASAPETDLIPWFIGGIIVLLIIFKLITLKAKP